MSTGPYLAIYDFELLPYALGDVLTWNVQTAIRCEQAGRERVDVCVSADPRYPASIYQEHHVTAENCGLYFSELFGAFGTHPRPGNLLIFQRREELLAHARQVAQADPANRQTLTDYERVLERRGDEDAVIEYFTRYLHSHESINAFAQAQGRIPLLRPSPGCAPDIEGLLRARFAGKRMVAIHMRLRRLDAGYSGEHTYARDSNFLEWYEFLKEAARAHPEVVFVALGRLQEKPLELLRLPNVISLRVLGMGLGHELSLLLRSDLFLGRSSGFAAMANFSAVPYFITGVTPESCRAYAIAPGAERLPFAAPRQHLTYEPETRELLMRLLERGLEGPPAAGGGRGPQLDAAIDVRSWEWERSRWLYPDATTSRFFNEAAYREKETAYLLWPRLKEAQAAWRAGALDQAWAMLLRLEENFGSTCERFPEFLRFKRELAVARNDAVAVSQCDARLAAALDRDGLRRGMARVRALLFPVVRGLRYLWKARHRATRRLAYFARLAMGSGRAQ